MIRAVPLLLLLSVATAACAQPTPPSSPPSPSPAQPTPTANLPGCELTEELVTTGDSRRLALLVGIDDYTHPKLPDLHGAVNDVRAVYQLLTAANGYGFPPRNICVLVDAEATVAGFRKAFQKALIDRARPGDQVFIFYSGHGSQASDRNRDEPDNMDETLVLHDSRTGNVSDLRDDELNSMLRALHARTENLTLVFDSCNAGSAHRGEADDAVARGVPAAQSDDDDSGARQIVEPGKGRKGGRKGGARQIAEQQSGDHGDWVPESLPGLVFLAAARDGTSALESQSRGYGYFTRAFLDVLSEAPATPLTWAQVARLLPPILDRLTHSRQVPVLQGDLERYVFDQRQRRRPLAWEITHLGETLELRGIDLPGWGVDAEAQVFSGAASWSEIHDPAAVKATLRLTRYDRFTATAVAVAPPRSELREGDLVVLMLPSPGALKLRLRPTPTDETGGLDKEQITTLERLLATDDEARHFVELAATTDAYSLRRDSDDRLTLVGPNGVVRNVFEGARDRQLQDAVLSAMQHARQRALLWLEGERGGEFTNGETLRARLVPDPRAPVTSPSWRQAADGETQILPNGARWQIEVTNTHAEATLLVGGAVLWNDGAMDGLPYTGDLQELAPGASAILDPSSSFEALPPFEAIEHVVIFGTQLDNPINWSILTAPSIGRVRGSDEGPLQAVLADYLSGLRGGRRHATERSTWTSSRVSFRVVDE